MANITFNRGQGGLGRPLTGFDHVSGLVFFHGTYPSGFDASNKIRKVLSLEEAEGYGILNNHSDETAASGGNFAFTNAGDVGQIIELQIDEGEGAFTIATATSETGETTSTLATKLRASMNDTSVYSHGYSAAGAGVNVLITPPAGLGDSINGGSKLTLKETPAGSAAATITQFSSGADGFHDVIYYQVSEFFRLNPKGVLYVGIFPDSSITPSRLSDMQSFANGEIRQIGVFNQKSTFASSDVTGLQTVCDTLAGLNTPLSVILAPDMTGLTLSSQPNLTTLDSENVSVLISGDGLTTSTTGFGASRKVFYKKAFTVAALGAALGTLSKAKVHENIGWIGQFNISDGDSLDQVEFLPSTGWSSASASLKTQLSNYGYLFLTKETDLAGTFFNNDKTATASTSDYARIRNVRTIDKAIRGVRAKLLPLVNSPLYVNSDGTLTEDTIAIFENEGNKIVGGVYNTSTASGSMVIAGEISAGETVIDPTQDVLATGEVVVTINLIPVGSAETITVNIGFVASFN
jgi:hypothetical protein